MNEERPILATVRDADVRRIALVAAAAIGVVGLLGVAYAQAKPGDLLESTGLRALPLGLDTEWSLPAFFSGGLLLAAAALAYLAGQLGVGTSRWPFVAIAGLFAFMGVDEIAVIHESLRYATGVEWQLLYLPIMLFGGIAWLAALRHLWPHVGARSCFAVGAGAWVLAQPLEWYQRADGVLHHRWTILPEEVLEMTGSALFGLGLLMAVQAALSRTGPLFGPYPEGRAHAQWSAWSQDPLANTDRARRGVPKARRRHSPSKL